ncbi:hypothetical protein B0H63DRAFT_521816 [Podospora didyma]|uniref:DUF6536 domain-containing protein n=1 Tax=Podospora didyma TaxID=330526 RepID=A0AAE0NUK2_9PEZI|nr:hypothetical protein B0H63DRAFT_521816 [Podospora didyma]
MAFPLRIPSLPREKWRRVATINTLLVIPIAFFLVIVSAIRISNADSIADNFMFYQGPCADTDKVNLILHLLLNIFSTLLLSSSNFFMQILNAPTRSEVDLVHASSGGSKWFEIGIPSMRNAFHVSRFKTLLWVLFCLSSVPIHLVFNSAIFATDFMGAKFHLTIATEEFVRGQKYHAPGASLSPPGGRTFSDSVNNTRPGASDWGHGGSLVDFLDPSSDISRALSDAARDVPSWKRLNTQDCLNEYRCSPRKHYRNLVLVVDSQLRNTSGNPRTDTRGFVPVQIYNMTRGTNATNNRARNRLRPSDEPTPYSEWKYYSQEQVEAHWSQYMPLSEPNTLWYSGQCLVYNMALSNHDKAPKTCSHTCGALLNFPKLSDPEWAIEVQSNDTRREDVDYLPWLRSDIATPRFFNSSTAIVEYKENPFLHVNYCYAQPFNPTCQVGLSNVLLLVVTVFVIIKAILCIIVLTRVKGDPLVTPGDAIASFITHPDPTTDLMATMTMADYRAGLGKSNAASLMAPGPRQWPKGLEKRLFAAISRGAWIRLYGMLAVIIPATAYLYRLGSRNNPLSTSSEAFSHSTENGLFAPTVSAHGFLASVLIANMPQLVLSIVYFSYNTLFSRILVEKEWRSYAAGPSPVPLRVTSPAGDQVATYRLQLPYRYSIPLIATSALLHWLVSITIYSFAIQGGYYSTENNEWQQWRRKGDAKWRAIQNSTDPDLDSYTALGMGYSTAAVLVVLIASIVLAIIPLALTFSRLKGRMVIGGTISTVISAACHVAPPSAPPRSSPGSCSHSHDVSKPMLATAAPPTTAFSEDWELTNLVASESTDDRETKKGGEQHETTIIRDVMRQEEEEHDDYYREITRTAYKDDDESSKYRLQLSRKKLKWGVVEMPPEWYAQFTGRPGADFEEGEVGHLSFASLGGGQSVRQPEEGRYYA